MSSDRGNHSFAMQSHHDLQSLPQCLHPFGRKLDQVCVNPYHYERIESAGIQPVLVPVMKSQRQQEKTPELDQKVQLCCWLNCSLKQLQKHFPDNVEPTQQALETFSLNDKSAFPSGSNLDSTSVNNGATPLRPGHLIKTESSDEMDSSASPGIDAMQSPYNSALSSPDVGALHASMYLRCTTTCNLQISRLCHMSSNYIGVALLTMNYSSASVRVFMLVSPASLSMASARLVMANASVLVNCRMCNAVLKSLMRANISVS